MVKIAAVCSDFPGSLEPSHGFGLLINDVLLFDSCSREAASAFLSRYPSRPLLGVAGVPGSSHHAGGFDLFNVPVVKPSGDLRLRVRGVEYSLFWERWESVLYVDNVLITPCGLYTLPNHKLSRRGLKARCVVGGLGGTAINPYVQHRVVAELRLLGARCLVVTHTAPQFVKELERKFNVFKIGAGSVVEI
ncbi:hypothetical protein [Pyrobaculum neutrophilum]|uniref:Uncharacterized protein n=1 Tax=Pyrobaculum neutrophilum (strain DSM 2338 / JCM 9278 / NBRC 100436 / V24Sta) TaxID=444157 RepID=B1YCZ4_PYRNV|nr:hypothetical protein [Pyrobaculum neutrophilum]ACB39657.1 conserved hypothetical protein [Pyrobaculum neutrophilum V24Sta]